ncbi:MAG: DUF1223 domain-containing protein [Ferruginibacter sp.]
MKKGLYYIAGLVIISSSLFFMASHGVPKNTNNSVIDNEETGFVVMELFTSQGCSSCPPADEILGMYALKNDEHIIPIAFHVDYWNRLGWVDSFSNNIFSQRQRAYAEKFNLESIYTPQLIINGQKQLTGSDENRIATITNGFLKEESTVTIKISAIKTGDGKVVVDYIVSNVHSNSSINAALVQRNIITQIKAGENRGVELNNYNIVRDFKTVQLTGVSGSFILQLPKGNSPSNYQVVLFVQENNAGIIKGAVKENCK